MIPGSYRAEGVLTVAGKVVSLEDAGGARWPLAVLLAELSGRRVEIRVRVVR